MFDDSEIEIVCLCNICHHEVKPTEFVCFTIEDEHYGMSSIYCCYRCANAIKYAMESAIEKIRNEKANKED